MRSWSVLEHPPRNQSRPSWSSATLRDLYRGKLAIGAAPITIGYFGLLDVVTGYNRLYPNIDLSISQYQAEQLMPMIANGAVDIGMLFVPSTGLSLLASLEVRPLFKQRSAL